VVMSEQQPRGRNRRLGPRRDAQPGVRLACVLGATGLGPNVARTLLDVSESGARFLARTTLEHGREVEVTLQGPADRQPLTLRGSVAWCVAAVSGEFCVGVRFQHYLSYDELCRLG
jgi:hypothetical protein